MTIPPKTMAEIRDAEAEKHGNPFNLYVSECGHTVKILIDQNIIAFKAGFDCRDKLDNEALKLAVECLEKYKDSAFEINGKIYKIGNKAEAALAEIRKLRGEV